jgi:hypothetical protein
MTKPVDEQGETVPLVKTLAQGDFRFCCVACGSDAIVKAAGKFDIANRLIGAHGWRIFVRGNEAIPLGRGGLFCVKCTGERQAAEALPREAATADA